MNLTDYTQYFPRITEPHIYRDNLVKYIDDCFNANVDIVTVEGEGDMGKTTLLAEYAKTHNEVCVSYFIPNVNKTTCDPEIMLTDIANQLNIYIYGKEMDLSVKRLDVEFQRLLFESDKKHRRTGNRLILVLDGLEHLTGQYEIFRNSILSNIPIGRRSFGILFSGDLSSIGLRIEDCIQHRPVTLTGFTFEETKKYFGDRIETVSKECYRITSGKPGLIASLSRVLTNEGEIPTKLSGKEASIERLFEFEWNSMEDKSIENVLALIAFGKRGVAIDEISEMIGIDSDKLRHSLKKLSFIRIGNPIEQLEFVSDSFGRFASMKLQNYQSEALDLTITSMLKVPKSQNSMLNLPTLLFQAERYDDVIEYVGGEYSLRYLEKTSSLSGLRKRIEIAARASEKRSREKELFKFSLQSALVIGCQMSEMWRDEIEALIALDNYEGALAIIQNITNPEIRFQMFAVLAKEVRRYKLPINPSIDETLKQLLSQLDFESIGKEKVLEIASDLVFSNTEMAFEILNRVVPTNPEGNSYDQLLARLALNTGAESNFDTVVLEKIKERVTDPDAKTISTAILAMAKDYNAEEIILRTDEIKDTSLKVLLLRKWTVRNARRNDAHIVVAKGIQCAIASTEYSPNALVFRELSEPLPYIVDKETALSLISIIDAQLGNIKKKGPIEEYFKLLLILAQTIWKYDIEVAKERILNAFWEIGRIEDLSVEVACLSYLQSFLERVDHNRILNKKEGLHAALNDLLAKEFEKLLICTAEHYNLAAVVLDSIGQYDVGQASMYAKQLNTQDRRDQAYRHIVLRHVRNLNYDIDLDAVNKICNQIADLELREDTILKICHALVYASPRGLEKSKDAFLHLLKLINTISNYELKCESLVYCYSFLTKMPYANDWMSRDVLLSDLIEIWKHNIITGWDKVILGYRIIRELCQGDKSSAKKFLALTEEERIHTKLQSPELSISVFLALLIAIRGFSGIVSESNDLSQEYDRLIQLIDSEQSQMKKAVLYNDLALRLFLHKRSDLFEKTINLRIKPLIATLKSTAYNEFKSVFKECSASLFISHSSTFFLSIEDLNQADRDQALLSVIDFIITKVPNRDPFDTGLKNAYRINFEDAINVCELLNRIENDADIYAGIESLVDGLTSKESNSKLNREQIQSIGQKLTSLIDIKLPNKNFITHDGYKIIAYGQIGRMSRKEIQYFENLLVRANSIPNLADRALVLTVLGEIIPENFIEKRLNALNEAYKITHKLPSSVEKANHLHSLSIATVHFNPTQSKNYLREAFGFAVADNMMDSKKRIMSIIDTAYKLDPEFAGSLASLITDDEATIGAKQEVNDRLELLKTKEQMVCGGSISQKRVELTSRAAWRMLASLNSGRIETNHMEEITPYLIEGSGSSIEDTYPIFSWIIENAIRRPIAKTALWGLYEASINAVEFLCNLNDKFEFSEKTENMPITQTNNIIIHPGQKDQALKYIYKWWEGSSSDHIVLCDQYFELPELTIFNYLNSIKHNIRVSILCGSQIIKEIKPLMDASTSLRTYWRTNISESNPPFIDFVIVGVKRSDQFPIHDRCLIADDSGLRIGTSINSLGITKVSEISRIEPQDFNQFKQMVFGYVNRSIREHNGERLEYTIYSI